MTGACQSQERSRRISGVPGDDAEGMAAELVKLADALGNR